MKKTPRPQQTSRKPSKAKKVLKKQQKFGWDTTDQEEIDRRRERGAADLTTIEVMEKDHPILGTFRVASGSGSAYEVEIRDPAGFTNSCGCADHQVNRLGTCKHIEGVLVALKKRRAAMFRQAVKEGSPRVEVFLTRNGPAVPQIYIPPKGGKAIDAVRACLSPWIDPRTERLTDDPEKIDALIQAYPAMSPLVRKNLRLSRHFDPWIARATRLKNRAAARAVFETERKEGRIDLDILKVKLLPYQQEGMIHLAFGERALLADEMGLGKTIQAIAACELLRQRKEIKRVLIVCPASVKAEWEDQIARFTDQTSRLVFGPRAARLALYAKETPDLFTIVNYEQVLGDAEDINTLFKPDIVVLDEAQRIKNWPTKTAQRVKTLQASHVFVLTGTPVENRIDEVYSIVP